MDKAEIDRRKANAELFRRDKPPMIDGVLLDAGPEVNDHLNIVNMIMLGYVVYLPELDRIQVTSLGQQAFAKMMEKRLPKA